MPSNWVKWLGVSLNGLHRKWCLRWNRAIESFRESITDRISTCILSIENELRHIDNEANRVVLLIHQIRRPLKSLKSSIVESTFSRGTRYIQRDINIDTCASKSECNFGQEEGRECVIWTAETLGVEALFKKKLTFGIEILWGGWKNRFEKSTSESLIFCRAIAIRRVPEWRCRVPFDPKYLHKLGEEKGKSTYS